jgi:hypothetical protein
MTTQHGQIEATKLAIKAYEDKQTIFGRFQSGKTERIEDGLLIRSHIDYGYKWNANRPLAGDEDLRTNWLPDEDGDPSSAAVVRRIFDYLSRGWRTGGDASAKQMAFQLQDDNIPPASALKGRSHEGTQWQHSMIISIVTNPSYKGSHPQNRWMNVPYTAEEKRKHELRTGKPYKLSYHHAERPQAEWVYAKVPALVDEQTWEDANKQIEHNQKHQHRTPVRFTTADALLWGGHVYCVECGHAMQVWRPTPQRSWCYHCRWSDPRGPHPSRTNNILVREVDEFVWSEANRIIRDPEYLRSRLVQTQQEVWTPEQQIAHYTALISKCDADENGWNVELAALGGDPLLANSRTYLIGLIKQNALGRQGYAEKRQDAQTEQLRRLHEQERLKEFEAKARAQAPTLDDLDAEQRRQLLLDLHAEVHIARPDNDREPRLTLLFSLTSEAAQRSSEVWATWTTHTAKGDYVTYIEQSGQSPAAVQHRDGKLILDFSHTTPPLDIVAQNVRSMEAAPIDEDGDAEHPSSTSPTTSSTRSRA